MNRCADRSPPPTQTRLSDSPVTAALAAPGDYRRAKLFHFPGLSPRIPYLEYRKGKYRYFTLFYHQAGVRHRETRSTYTAAQRRAREIAVAIQNGETDILSLRHAEKSIYLAACEAAAPTGKSLVRLAEEYAESHALLAGRCTIADACRDWLTHHPPGQVERTTADLLTEFLAKRPHLSPKYRRNLVTILERFAARFPGPVTGLQAPAIDDWLDTPSTSARTRSNYRAAIANLCHYARTRGYLPKDWSVLDNISDPRPAPSAVNLYTPDELVRLLNKAETSQAGRKLVPLICITAFAGVRHGEMNEEKIEHLDWADIDWDAKIIFIRAAAAKTARARVIDMPENLVAWLEPYRRPRGRICDLRNTSSALCRLRKQAGITGPKKNALRKSFISYKKALTADIAAVADAAGNSAHIIRRHYLHIDTRMRADAARWFAIIPTRADILPLFEWAKK